MKPNMFVNPATVGDEEITVGTLMEHNDPPSLVVQVTDLEGLPGAFTGTQLDNGFHTNNWDYDAFHIFRGEITLSQGF